MKGKRNYKYEYGPEAVPSVQSSCERTIAIATRENEIQKNVSDAALFRLLGLYGEAFQRRTFLTFLFLNQCLE